MIPKRLSFPLLLVSPISLLFSVANIPLIVCWETSKVRIEEMRFCIALIYSENWSLSRYGLAWAHGGGLISNRFKKHSSPESEWSVESTDKEVRMWIFSATLTQTREIAERSRIGLLCWIQAVIGGLCCSGMTAFALAQHPEEVAQIAFHRFHKRMLSPHTFSHWHKCSWEQNQAITANVSGKVENLPQLTPMPKGQRHRSSSSSNWFWGNFLAINSHQPARWVPVAGMRHFALGGRLEYYGGYFLESMDFMG